MTLHCSFEGFDSKTLLTCLRYVIDTFEWLTANGNNLFQVMDQMDYASAKDITAAIRALLSNARSVQNAYARINTLPPELLSLILQFLVLPPAEAAFAPKGLSKVNLPVAGHVCRYWRRIAHATPKLWTIIQIDRQRLRRVEDARYFLSLSLSRSGSLPLSVYLAGPTPMMELSQSVSRIEDLRLWDVSRALRLSLSSEAGQLRELQVTNLTGDPYVGDSPVALFNGWKTPQLRSMSMVGCADWQLATFGHLHHLTIASQHIGPDTARTLLHVLSSHPALEDLILSDIEVPHASTGSFTQLRQRVEMRRLKRLCIRDMDSTAALDFVGLVNSSLDITTPDGCAKYYDLSFPRRSAPELIILALPSGTLGIPTSLTIDDSKIVGTDGQSAFNITHYPERRLDTLLLQCADVSEVQELRLLQPVTAFAFAALERMQQVSTLVITRDVEHWLDEITKRNLFLELEDLSLLVGFDTSVAPIIRFLQGRKQGGRPIRTLRFIEDLSEIWRRAFQAEEFSPYVDRVVFDQSNERSIMPLPLMCRTEYALSPGYWNPSMWKSRS